MQVTRVVLLFLSYEENKHDHFKTFFNKNTMKFSWMLLISIERVDMI